MSTINFLIDSHLKKNKIKLKIIKSNNNYRIKKENKKT